MIFEKPMKQMPVIKQWPKHAQGRGCGAVLGCMTDKSKNVLPAVSVGWCSGLLSAYARTGAHRHKTQTGFIHDTCPAATHCRRLFGPNDAMVVVSKNVHPRGLDFRNQRKLVLLKDIHGLSFRKIAP